MTLDEVNEFLCFGAPEAQARVMAASRSVRVAMSGANIGSDEIAAAALAATELAIIAEPGALEAIWRRRAMRHGCR